jgi:YVTN family beta-propeller protein
MDPGSRFNFVTLRGGGLFVVDSKATPMAIVAEYDKDSVHPNGCVGLAAQGKMYISSGGGTAANPLESDLYSFPLTGYSATPNPPNTPVPTLVFSHDARGFVDGHGSAATRHGRYLWVADRAANSITVVDTTTDIVVNEIRLAGDLTTDPAPDLMDIAPSGNRIYFAMRGPIPLTGNAPAVNNAVGNSPGVGVLRVEANGSHGVVHSVARISHVVDGAERADAHAIIVRRR